MATMPRLGKHLLLIWISLSALSLNAEIVSSPQINDISTTLASRSAEDETYLCGEDGRLYRERGNMLRRCSSDVDCLPPAACGNAGVCCIRPLAQEPPPVGCPKGSRPLRNSRGEELHCTPNRPNACPGGATCYEDSYDRLFRCCGKDPSEGCASGMRALKHANGTSRLCTPGAADGGYCPGSAICQWSFTIDRYQCCEPDNGCPVGQMPVLKLTDSSEGSSMSRRQLNLSNNFKTNNNVIACSPNEPEVTCPDGAVCSFNFWTAAYQCCRHPADEICPAGDVPYLTTASSTPFSCRLDADCPPQFYCHHSMAVCCRQAGECARPDQLPYRDRKGGMRACSPAAVDACPAGSECVEAVAFTANAASIAPMILIVEEGRSLAAATLAHRRAATDKIFMRQFLCCTSDSERKNGNGETKDRPDTATLEANDLFSCGLYGQPFPNAKRPQRCSANVPMTCPVDMICQPSNVADVHICCTVSERAPETPSTPKNLCPRGWLLHDDVITFCHLTQRRSCPDFASCILSPATQQFLCCEPERFIAVSKRGAADDTVATNNTVLTDGVGYGSAEGTLSARLPFDATLFDDACPAAGERVELVNGRVRRCSTRARRCGASFICRRVARQLSKAGDESELRRSRRRSICCGGRKRLRAATDEDYVGAAATVAAWRDEPALFRCPNAGQLPYLVDNRNVFCTIGRNDCPLGTACQSAINSANMFICCQTSDVPTCPGLAAAQPAPVGYVPCDLLRPNQCRAGYICVPAANDPSMSLCCSRSTNNRLICPNQQALYLEGGRPRYCTLSQQAPCPTGFACQKAVGQPGVRACCSLPTNAVCPTGYTPSADHYSGGIINCSPTNMNVCPLDSQCLQAPNRAGAFLCCESTAAPRVCPFGQHALLRANTNQLETCTDPAASCSATSFTCQFSPVMNAYVCCGRPQPVILCADGRETYGQETGKTFVCNPMTYPRDCPSGFECAHSNVGNVHVCCRQSTLPLPEPQQQPPPPLLPTATFRPQVDEITCPIGWSAYEDNRGAHHFCLDALDMSCPCGFSCAQSSITGIFMCCRLAGTIQCPKSYSTLIVNNAPRLCSPFFGLPPAPVPLPQPQPVAAARQPPLAGSGSCPLGYSCMQSSVPAIYVCCSAATRGDLMCRDGQIPAYLGQFVRSCATVGLTDGCPPTYVCAPSDRPGLNVCCHILPVQSALTTAKRMMLRQPNAGLVMPVPAADVCGDTAAVFRSPTSGRPMECGQSQTATCPRGYECIELSISNGKRYCCQPLRCPNTYSIVNSNRQPQRCMSDEECEIGRTCQTADNSNDVKICCDIAALSASTVQLRTLERRRQTRCLNEVDTLIVGNGAYACTAYEADRSCPPDYYCTNRTTSGESICCAYGTAGAVTALMSLPVGSEVRYKNTPESVPTSQIVDLRVCPDNREPFRHLDSGRLTYCETNHEGCPQGFLCKTGVSVAAGRQICCSPVAACPRGRRPLIDRTNNDTVVRCAGIQTADCPAGYSCSESTAPGLYVCCASSEDQN